MTTELISFRKDTFADDWEQQKKKRKTYWITTGSVMEAHSDFFRMTGTPENQLFMLPEGEFSKTWEVAGKILDWLVDEHAGKDTLIVCWGGGSVSDVGGFVASIFKRGVPCWNIPTTILSMTDAAIGGKTGIDWKGYKNMVGTIVQPEALWLNPGFLKSLSPDELRFGWAETVKHAIILDPIFFDIMLEKKSVPDFPDEGWILRSAAIKRRVVEQDPSEKGIRKILNMGHTLGHALEACYLDRSTPLPHGKAVAWGMWMESKCAVNWDLMSQSDFVILERYLLNNFPEIRELSAPVDELMRHALQDKKNQGTKIGMAILHQIGHCEPGFKVDASKLEQTLNSILAS